MAMPGTRRTRSGTRGVSDRAATSSRRGPEMVQDQAGPGRTPATVPELPDIFTKSEPQCGRSDMRVPWTGRERMQGHGWPDPTTGTHGYFQDRRTRHTRLERRASDVTG